MHHLRAPRLRIEITSYAHSRKEYMIKILTKIRSGFTLIELLVVISIIGILVVIATANMITAQKQARDSRRMEDMQSIQSAFETYYAINTAYPIDGQIDTAFDSTIRPEDPKGTTYSWLTDADSYCVCATMESKPGNASGSSADSCTWATGGTYFCVQNRQ